jgi:UDP-3-O-[3-hydroxymyristoyl] N-acetylglucosamine deacetylase/3-hydroxyacyl-[acyl-carrier-protein] dehydratase
LEGLGLHTGSLSHLVLRPASPNTGLKFIRTDLSGRPVVDAKFSNITNISRRHRRTSVGANGVEIHTIEHLTSAMGGLGIANIIAEIDSDEIPVLDGSALPFCEALLNAGIEEQNVANKKFMVKEVIWIEEQDASITILPGDAFRVSYTLSYKHPFVHSQYAKFDITPEIFTKEIAPARTFCFEEEVEDLRRQGLGAGATYDNTLVISDKGVIDNRLRFPDEFVRHKIMDIIGDFYLLGADVQGHVLAIKTGHTTNMKLLNRMKLIEDQTRDAGIPARYTYIPGQSLDITTIQKIIPHRYPFLLVDRVIRLEEDKKCVAIKNLTANEEFFQGHFPGKPVMPGVLIIEALAQTAGILFLSSRMNLGKMAFFMSLDNVKFRRPVIPGDQVILETEVIRLRTRTGQIKGVAYVDNKVVVEAEIMFALSDMDK